MFDKLRRSATKVVDQHGDKIAKGLDKAAGAVDKRTKHKYSGQIRTGVGKAKEGLDRLDTGKGRRDQGGGSPGSKPPGTTPESGPEQPPGTGSTPPSS